MNFRIVSSPGVVVAIGSLAAMGVLIQTTIRERWIRIRTDNRSWSASLAPTIAGAFAAFLFNDSGIVAAIYFLAAPAAVAGYLLCSPNKSFEPS